MGHRVYDGKGAAYTKREVGGGRNYRRIKRDNDRNEPDPVPIIIGTGYLGGFVMSGVGSADRIFIIWPFIRSDRGRNGIRAYIIKNDNKNVTIGTFLFAWCSVLGKQ